MHTFATRPQKRAPKSSTFEPDKPILQPSQSLAPVPLTAPPISNRASAIDWQAEVAQAKRFGYSIGRLAIHAPALAANQIIQRVAGAKDVLVAPNKTAIPDLPANEVTILEEACKDESKRQAALDALYTYLKGRGIVDDAEVDSFAYEKNTQTYGLADESKKDKSKLAVFIYSIAFDAGAPVVYSTLRHELIHVEQQRISADTVADSNDAFFYHDSSRGGRFQGAAQHAVQEIETHAWEIENAGATGIDEGFVKGRRNELYTYYKNLCEYASKLKFQEQQNWQGYIDKAKALAEKHLDVKDFPRMTINWKTGTGKIKTVTSISKARSGGPYAKSP